MPIMLVLFFIVGSIQSADQSSLTMLAAFASDLPHLSIGHENLQKVTFTLPEALPDSQISEIINESHSFYRVPLRSLQAAIAARESIKKKRVREYSCPDCSKKFSDKSRFKRHKIIHTGVKKYLCNYCGKAFFRKDTRDRHEEGTLRCINKRSKQSTTQTD